jgi:hypothetical protein
MSAPVRSIVWGFAVLFAVAALVAGFAASVQAQQPARTPVQFPPAGTQSVTVGCAAAVYGGMGPDWRSPANGTLIAGPIAWPVLRQLATDSGGPRAASYAPRHGLATSVKALVAVNAGTVVWVRIPASERMRLSLDYTYIQTGRNTSQGTYFRVADGASQVTFKACSLAQNPTGQPSQFAGGFIVAGAQCARIDIYTSAKSRPLVRQLPLGVPGRSCPATGREAQ